MHGSRTQRYQSSSYGRAQFIGAQLESLYWSSCHGKTARRTQAFGRTRSYSYHLIRKSFAAAILNPIGTGLVNPRIPSGLSINWAKIQCAQKHCR